METLKRQLFGIVTGNSDERELIGQINRVRFSSSTLHILKSLYGQDIDYLS
jgi:hypothetical protein